MIGFFKGLLKRRNLFTHFLWIAILLYAVASVNLLVIAVNWYKQIPGAYMDPRTLIAFSVTSFCLVILVSAYHLSSLIRRRKRRTDRAKLSRGKFIRARNHRSPHIF